MLKLDATIMSTIKPSYNTNSFMTKGILYMKNSDNHPGIVRTIFILSIDLPQQFRVDDSLTSTSQLNISSDHNNSKRNVLLILP